MQLDTKATRRGRVVESLAEQNSVTLAVEFDPQRCKNCSCSFGALGNSRAASLASYPQVLRFTSSGGVENQRLTVGQNVLVSLPASRLRATTAVLFGAPLLLAIGCCAIAAALGLAGAIQGLLALAGFAAGGWVSYCVRDRLQQRFYERLSVTPLDC